MSSKIVKTAAAMMLCLSFVTHGKTLTAHAQETPLSPAQIMGVITRAQEEAAAKRQKEASAQDAERARGLFAMEQKTEALERLGAYAEQQVLPGLRALADLPDSKFDFVVQAEDLSGRAGLSKAYPFYGPSYRIVTNIPVDRTDARPNSALSRRHNKEPSFLIITVEDVDGQMVVNASGDQTRVTQDKPNERPLPSSAVGPLGVIRLTSTYYFLRADRVATFAQGYKAKTSEAGPGRKTMASPRGVDTTRKAGL